MILKCRFALTFVCLFAVFNDSCAGLPLSDLTPHHDVPRETSEREHTTKQNHDVRLQKWQGDDLRAALCPYKNLHWDIDIKCTDSNGLYLSIGHCLTYGDKNGKNKLHEFKCPYFQLEGHLVNDLKIDFSFGSYLVLLFLSATLLVAIVRPYKERYMNIFDTLILGHFTFMSKMQTDNYSKGMGTQLFILNLIPAFALGICLSYVKIYKVYNFRCCGRRGPRARGDNPWPYQSTFEDDIFDNSGTKNKSNMTSSRDIETQPLLTPTAD